MLPHRYVIHIEFDSFVVTGKLDVREEAVVVGQSHESDKSDPSDGSDEFLAEEEA
jgi:hypothetical protein